MLRRKNNYCQEHRELTTPGNSTDNLVQAGSRTKTSNCSVNKQQTHMSTPTYVISTYANLCMLLCISCYSKHLLNLCEIYMNIILDMTMFPDHPGQILNGWTRAICVEGRNFGYNWMVSLNSLSLSQIKRTMLSCY